MKTLVISYDDKHGYGTVVDPDGCVYSEFVWNGNHEIVTETPDTDCEDFNDNARWLIKTLLAILEMEKQDEAAHCDWTADADKDAATGKYRFNVELKRVDE